MNQSVNQSVEHFGKLYYLSVCVFERNITIFWCGVCLYLSKHLYSLNEYIKDD